VAQTTSTTLACDVRAYIAEETLSIAEKELRLYQLGVKADLPEGHGTTFQYARYERLPLPTSTLTEGTAPTSTSMSVTMVTAVAEQWGGLVSITDVAQMTIAHKPLVKAIELLGVQNAETTEREVFNVLLSGTNVFYGSPADDTTRTLIATNAVFNEIAIKTVVANLRANGARGMEAPAGMEGDPGMGDMYVGVIDPYVEQDLTSFAGFISVNQYNGAKRIWQGEAGSLHGVRWIRSNVLPTITSLASVAGSNATAGGVLATGTLASVNFVITGVDVNTGYETLIVQGGTIAQHSTGNTAKVWVTTPTNASYTYNIYSSTSSGGGIGACRLYTYGIANTTSIAIASFAAATADLVPEMPAAATSKIHISFIIGREAYTVVNLKSLESFLTPPGESDSDPLAQRRKAGWKVFFKACINNNNFMARYEAESNFD